MDYRPNSWISINHLVSFFTLLFLLLKKNVKTDRLICTMRKSKNCDPPMYFMLTYKKQSEKLFYTKKIYVYLHYQKNSQRKGKFNIWSLTKCIHISKSLNNVGKKETLCILLD